jgi:hypothetical protein
MAKTLALTSGGLDSLLAVKLLALQGVDVVMVHLVSIFSPRRPPGAPRGGLREFAKRHGIELIQVSRNSEMLEVIRNPKHGYGKNMNPCIDCRIAMLRRAKEMMARIGADFITTGEVVGQRPMSQRRHTLALIEKEAGLERMVLRPLSAKALPPTIPEERGWVDREKLHAITGRSRKEQMRLADELGIGGYPSPGGGCLLTFSAFAEKVADLLDAGGGTLNDFHLLKMGRHFRIGPRVRAVVGKDVRDNAVISSFANPGDAIVELVDIPGPTTLVRGVVDAGEIERAAAVTARYTNAASDRPVRVRIADYAGRGEKVIEVVPAAEDEIEKYRIGGGQ